MYQYRVRDYCLLTYQESEKYRCNNFISQFKIQLNLHHIVSQISCPCHVPALQFENLYNNQRNNGKAQKSDIAIQISTVLMAFF